MSLTRKPILVRHHAVAELMEQYQEEDGKDERKTVDGAKEA